MKPPDIHQLTFDNLLDGVLVVGSGGRLETLNRAAKHILGLDPDTEPKGGFTELFITREGFDEFTELVIGATIERTDGARQTVKVHSDAGTRTLSVATSYCRLPGKETDTLAVIVVFSDVTQLEALRENEILLAQTTEEQHAKLQEAYRAIEERNSALGSALRKVRVIQTLGAVVVVGLFVAAGLRTLPSLGEPKSETVNEQGYEDETWTDTVTKETVTSGITVAGKLEPWQVRKITTSAEATIARVHYRTGQTVERDELLIELDLSELERSHEQARLGYVRARKELETLVNWEASPQMTTARRSLNTAKLARETQALGLRKTEFLHEQGLVSDEEYESALREKDAHELQVVEATEQLERVRARAGQAALDTARLGVEIAEAEMDATTQGLKAARIAAPIDGVVLEAEEDRDNISEGISVEKGTVIAQIADLSRFSATILVEEAHIGALKIGQAVTGTGNAFRGISLRGTVASIAAQAQSRNRTNLAKFKVNVTFERLPAQDNARLRSGMSVNLRITTYRNPDALTVPIDAVRTRAGLHTVRTKTAHGTSTEEQVRVGRTTQDRIEILEGLSEGQTVIVSSGEANR